MLLVNGSEHGPSVYVPYNHYMNKIMADPDCCVDETDNNGPGPNDSKPCYGYPQSLNGKVKYTEFDLAGWGAGWMAG